MPTETLTAASGNWTKPANVTSVTVECWGGGGAGGAGGSTGGTRYGGGGGKGGQYASKVLTYGAASQDIPYTVAQTTTGNGGDTTWDTNQVIARGGRAGQNATNAALGTGSLLQTGTGVGDVLFDGGNGASGVGTTSSGGGGGGAGTGGAGGNASGTTAGTGTAENGGDGGVGRTTNVAGGNGNIYGGAGGGGRSSGNAGGTGAAGLIRVTYSIGGGLAFIMMDGTEELL